MRVNFLSVQYALILSTLCLVAGCSASKATKSSPSVVAVTVDASGGELILTAPSSYLYSNCQFDNDSQFLVQDIKDSSFVEIFDSSKVSQSVYFIDDKIVGVLENPCDSGPVLVSLNGLKLTIPRSMFKYNGEKILGEDKLEEANQAGSFAPHNFKAEDKIPSYITAPIYAAKLYFRAYIDGPDKTEIIQKELPSIVP